MVNALSQNIKFKANINYLPIMSSYEEQSTNFMTNPYAPNQSFLKQKLIEDPPQYQDQENSKTIAFPNVISASNDQTIKPGKMPKKIKPALNNTAAQLPSCLQNQSEQKNNHSANKSTQEDDTATKTRRRNFTNTKIIICQQQQQKLYLSGKPQKLIDAKVNFNLKVSNKKSDETAQVAATIIAKPSIRQKFTHLLPKIHQKSISSDQQHLITILSMMDETIEFSTKNRATKVLFFQDLRKIIRDSLKVLIDFIHLEQLLFLDENLYQIKWERQADNRGFDIIMNLPQIKSKQTRKNKVRETIVQYLSVKHKEFLNQRGIQDFSIDGPWHPEFEPCKYEIPRKTLPPHPETRAAQLRCFDDKKINAIKNEKVKQLFKSEKKKSQVQSFKQQSAMEMIFAGTDAKVLQERLMAQVKEKQEQTRLKLAQQQKQIYKEKTTIESSILKEIAEVLLKTYMSRNVSNIFKVKVIEIVKEKTNNKYGDFVVNRHIEYLVEQKTIGFLKEITTRDKTVVLQINTSKYKEVLAHAQSLKEQSQTADVQI